MSVADPKVFISYRREDSSGHAGRLFDAMAVRFGEENMFMDVDLAPGVDFVERIKQAIGSCRVLLVLIGPRWMTLASDEGTPRLADSEDFVRLEVETALRRSDVTVIPVLVGGAPMPDPDELPEGVRPLAYRNAIELSDLRWRYDLGRLNARLDELLAGATGIHAVAGDRAPAHPIRAVAPTIRLLVEGMLVAGSAAMVGRLLSDPIRPGDQATETGEILVAIAKRSLTWAVLGTALAAWLSFVRGETSRLARRALAGLALGALAGALGALTVNLPQRLPDPNLEADTVRTISIAGFAVSSALIGGMLGSLWTPRRAVTGVIAGLAAGAAVRVLWNQLDPPQDSAIEAGLQFGFQGLLIVGLILLSLRALATEPGDAGRS